MLKQRLELAALDSVLLVVDFATNVLCLQRQEPLGSAGNRVFHILELLVEIVPQDIDPVLKILGCTSIVLVQSLHFQFVAVDFAYQFLQCKVV